MKTFLRPTKVALFHRLATEEPASHLVQDILHGLSKDTASLYLKCFIDFGSTVASIEQKPRTLSDIKKWNIAHRVFVNYVLPNLDKLVAHAAAIEQAAVDGGGDIDQPVPVPQYSNANDDLVCNGAEEGYKGHQEMLAPAYEAAWVDDDDATEPETYPPPPPAPPQQPQEQEPAVAEVEENSRCIIKVRYDFGDVIVHIGSHQCIGDISAALIKNMAHIFGELSPESMFYGLQHNYFSHKFTSVYTPMHIWSADDAQNKVLYVSSGWDLTTGPL